MRKPYYIISGVIAYLVFLFVTVPAAPVLSYLQSDEISMQGISGGLWNGSAAAITINRQHVLTDTSWDINLWRLFIGQFSAHINSQLQQQPVVGDFSINLAGTITARDTRASLDAATLAQLAQVPMGEFAGNVVLQIDWLEWQQHKLPHAVGTVQWNGAAITIAETVDLGDVIIRLTESDTQPLNANISNREGQIKLEGEANVSEDGIYSLQLNMLPGQNATGNIRSSLGMIAKPKPDGSYQLDNSGNLKQFGLI